MSDESLVWLRGKPAELGRTARLLPDEYPPFHGQPVPYVMSVPETGKWMASVLVPAAGHDCVAEWPEFETREDALRWLKYATETSEDERVRAAAASEEAKH